MLTLVRKRQLLAQLKENIADMAAYRGNADRVTCCEKESQLIWELLGRWGSEVFFLPLITTADLS